MTLRMDHRAANGVRRNAIRACCADAIGVALGLSIAVILAALFAVNGTRIASAARDIGLPSPNADHTTDQVGPGNAYLVHMNYDWDDDDWYASDHLRDLVDALRYSGAGMVGKAAEFVHLTSLGITMRRFAHAAETMSTTVAGGTLMLRTETLRGIGGWPAGPKRVDRLLIEALAERGMPTYRTHGSGYLLRRDSHPGSHTWQVEDDYFLRQSVDQRPGLDLAFAGVDQ